MFPERPCPGPGCAVTLGNKIISGGCPVLKCLSCLQGKGGGLLFPVCLKLLTKKHQAKLLRPPGLPWMLLGSRAKAFIVILRSGCFPSVHCLPGSSPLDLQPTRSSCTEPRGTLCDSCVLGFPTLSLQHQPSCQGPGPQCPDGHVAAHKRQVGSRKCTLCMTSAAPEQQCPPSPSSPAPGEFQCNHAFCPGSISVVSALSDSGF